MENESVSSARIKATVSAHVLILDQRLRPDRVKILLARLAYRDHRARKWSFPGGYVDQGEGLETALKREVSEEIGVELVQCRYLETVPLLLIEAPNIGFIFLCDSWKGTPEARSREILETAWVDEETFWQLDREGQLAYPQMREQTRSLGWHPPPSEEPVPVSKGRCIWTRMVLFLLLTLGAVSADAGNSRVLPSEDDESAFEETFGDVRDRLMDAVRALGKAGRKTLEDEMPALKEKAQDALKETERMFKDLEKQIPPPAEQKKTPETPPRKELQI
ncbi:MAG: NUDIX hydrolase [Magnetococcales bacterium]|nr:NUDIX hydrolase [Magnetococcales bacterium]